MLHVAIPYTSHFIKFLKLAGCCRFGDGLVSEIWFRTIFSSPCEEYGFHYNCGKGYEFYELGSCAGQCLTVEGATSVQNWKVEISIPFLADRFLLGKGCK